MKTSMPSANNAQYLPELRLWCRQALGQRLAVAEQAALSELLSDIFGYHLVVLDPPCQPESMSASRILHRVVHSSTAQGMESPPGLLGSAENLPLKSDSVDAFVLPHVLEPAADAHQVLREIDRCLVAEGHVIILGFNPYSWWGLRRLMFGWRGRVPWSLKFYSLPRLKDWLSLLGFDTIKTRYLFPHPPWQYGAGHAKERLLHRFHRDRWPWLAASYVLVARKRVATLTPIKPRWRPRRAVLAGGIAETRQGSLRPHG
ncbi:MAG TPA: methyltransferase domain-containing protein [Gammaproteobacteria bacterium]|nr:methyltransferase domain-containing protein [Gammaproteobacteria bacterium]